MYVYIFIYSNILLSYVLLIAIMVPSNSDLHVPRKYGELILTKTHLICYTFTCCICESYRYLPWVDVYPPISEFISLYPMGGRLYIPFAIKTNKVVLLPLLLKTLSCKIARLSVWYLIIPEQPTFETWIEWFLKKTFLKSTLTKKPS